MATIAFFLFMVFRTTEVQPIIEQRHWKATECMFADDNCLRQHDARVTTTAIMSGEVRQCWQATNPGRCASAVRTVLGLPVSELEVNDAAH